GEDVDEMADAEALPGAVDGGDRLLRGDGAVPAFDRRKAGVAIAARPVLAFAEIAEQHLPAATRALAEAEQRIELLPLDAALLLGQVAALDAADERHHVGHAVGHPGIGREPVASGPAGLLVIGLEAARRIEMGDEAHVGLVDAHAEGDGGDDDDAFLLEEALL